MLKKISYYAITFVLLGVKYLSLLLGRRLRNKLGKLLGLLGFKVWKSRRTIAIDNLTMAFPGKSFADINRIALESFQSLAITLMELLSLDKMRKKTLNKIIDWGDSLNLIHEVYARKRGCLFLSGHFGNWELIAYAVQVRTHLPISVIVKPQANYIADKMLNKIRTSSGNKLISMYHAARTLVDIARKGEVLALLADQSATQDKDIYVDFFGKKTATYKVVAELALHYNIPIIMGFAIRQPDGRYKAELTEIDFSDLTIATGKQTDATSQAIGNRKAESIHILTQRHVQDLEEVIRRYPGQWAWMHRRWKHS